VNLWTLEWRRLYRTPQAIALGAVFVAIGLIEPIVTKYENKLFAHASAGIRVVAPPPVPADALSSYVSEAFLLGLILVVALAAGPMSFDARPGLTTFLRTRVSNFWRLIGPRVAVIGAAAVVAYLLGTGAAWYETRLLIGPLPAGGMFAGMLCGAVYLAFAVALTALAAAVVRGRLAVAGTTLGMLIALPVIGLLSDRVASWLPSALADAPVSLANGSQQLAHYGPAIGVSLAAGAAALTFAVGRLRRREV
jgi:ABC-2 type transport system permease protein